jgi:hypothetical protein
MAGDAVVETAVLANSTRPAPAVLSVRGLINEFGARDHRCGGTWITLPC